MSTDKGTSIQMQENEIVLYQPNDTIHLEVRMANESVWLTQQQIAMLFGVKQPAISKHLNNIFRSRELDVDSVHSILEHTVTDGKVYQTQFYNLDAILSVGYRVNSINAAVRKMQTERDIIPENLPAAEDIERVELFRLARAKEACLLCQA